MAHEDVIARYATNLEVCTACRTTVWLVEGKRHCGCEVKAACCPQEPPTSKTPARTTTICGRCGTGFNDADVRAGGYAVYTTGGSPAYASQDLCVHCLDRLVAFLRPPASIPTCDEELMAQNRRALKSYVEAYHQASDFEFVKGQKANFEAAERYVDSMSEDDLVAWCCWIEDEITGLIAAAVDCTRNKGSK